MPLKRPIVPVENVAPAGTARVGSKVTAQQIVVHLRADSAGTLARQAEAGRDVSADVHRRQEGVQVLQVKMDNPALHDGTGGGVDRVLGIAGPKTVHIPAHLDLIQTVVDAVNDTGDASGAASPHRWSGRLRLARSQTTCGCEPPSPKRMPHDLSAASMFTPLPGR